MLGASSENFCDGLLHADLIGPNRNGRNGFRACRSVPNGSNSRRWHHLYPAYDPGYEALHSLS
jgi:hypothetical protein